MRTRDRLAAELRKVAAQASPANAEKYEAFAKRAETGEFDDFADTYDCPITQLYNELLAAGFIKFASRVAGGEFDATKEESDEWARSPAGQDVARRLPPEMREAMGFAEPKSGMRKVPVRLAMRHEGNYWNAYLAKGDTMEGARLLGSIMFAVIERNTERRQAFLDIMKDCVADAVERAFGQRPDMGDEGPAPESERSGHG